MSYGVAAALQTAIYQTLLADPTLVGLVGSDVYDAIPTGAVPSLYVALGAELVRNRSDQTGHGAEHIFTVSVMSDSAGFALAKTAAGAVSDALLDTPLTLTRGGIVALNFHRAKAVRVGSADERRIDLVFKALVHDD